MMTGELSATKRKGGQSGRATAQDGQKRDRLCVQAKLHRYPPWIKARCRRSSFGTR